MSGLLISAIFANFRRKTNKINQSYNQIFAKASSTLRKKTPKFSRENILKNITSVPVVLILIYSSDNTIYSKKYSKVPVWMNCDRLKECMSLKMSDSGTRLGRFFAH
jgi:hypothetical protein